jgi:hypothetical protein
MITPPPALPSGHLLLTPDAIPYEFLEYLESAGINDPGDDLDFIVVTDADRLVSDLDAMISTGSNGLDDKTEYWMLDDVDPLRPIVSRYHCHEPEWYKVQFADGLKAVGICSH